MVCVDDRGCGLMMLWLVEYIWCAWKIGVCVMIFGVWEDMWVVMIFGW